MGEKRTVVFQADWHPMKWPFDLFCLRKFAVQSLSFPQRVLKHDWNGSAKHKVGCDEMYDTPSVIKFVSVCALMALFVNARTTWTAVHCPFCIDFTMFWAVSKSQWWTGRRTLWLHYR